MSTAEPVAAHGEDSAAGSAVDRRNPPGFLRTMAMFGAVVAPTSLLTSLLYYFGWSHAYWFFNYFGVNSTLLGLTTTDYLMRSVDALFTPMMMTAFCALFVLAGHAVLSARLGATARRRLSRFLIPAAATAGLLLSVAGLVSVVVATPLSGHLAAAPLCLTAGVLLLSYALHLHRRQSGADEVREPWREWATVIEWAVVFVLVGLSLFWAATDYATAVGTRRARQYVAELPTYPDAVIYSEHSLGLHAAGVQETRCRDPKAAYRFRYTGLKLMLQSGGQYVFVPAKWTAADGVAMLLPRGDSVRLEFSPVTARGATLRPTC